MKFNNIIFNIVDGSNIDISKKPKFCKDEKPIIV